MKPRILFLVPSDYSDLAEKGVADAMKDREEQGYFDRVITVHPWARQTRVLDISPVSRFYEFQVPQGRTVLRYPVHVIHWIRLLVRITRIIDQEHISLIRATEACYTGLLAWLVTRWRPRPWCISIHADYDKGYELNPAQGAPTIFRSRRAAKWIEGFTLRRAPRVLPIREALAKAARQAKVPEERIRIIPHGIDLTEFSRGAVDLRTELGIAPACRLISFAGRLARENFAADAITLASHLKKKRSDFVMVIAGDGPERPAMEQRLRAESLTDVVRLMGFKPRDWCLQLRRQSTVSLCLMGGYSLIEACAAGSPVIAYDVDWHSELVKTGVTGYLLREGDTEGLTHAVNRLLDSPEEVLKMGAAARTLAAEKHDRLKTSSLKRQYYEELLHAFSR